ncbi:hypothetical protein [Helicobacter ailurogastricus]|nr:hypothetical protein [Helicobacter ailurogastricus]
MGKRTRTGGARDVRLNALEAQYEASERKDDALQVESTEDKKT